MKNRLNNHCLRLEINYLICAAIFDRDINFGFHRLTIHQRPIKLPVANRAHYSGHQRETAADGLEVSNSAILVHKRAYGDGVALARLNPGVGLFRRDLSEQFAHL